MALDMTATRIVTIAGTNGKGSCAQALQDLALAADCSVGCYTSPHLWRYNERIRINGQPATDQHIVQAFEAIEACRQEVSLSYFEYGSLAALYLFAHAGLDVWVLEVGLGGRLDAVNVVDADVAIVTSIGLDHQTWLGSDLSVIGREKAAIARARKPLFLGPGLPPSVHEMGQELGAHSVPWDARKVEQSLGPFLVPAGLVKSNLALAGLAAQALGLVLCEAQISKTLSSVVMPGRCQRVLRDGREEIYDVAHNPDATEHLATYLSTLPKVGPVTAVFSALQDKAVEDMVKPLLPHIDSWCIAALDDDRAMSLDQMQSALNEAQKVRPFESVSLALQTARQEAQRVVVCGSFLTVAAAGNEIHG